MPRIRTPGDGPKCSCGKPAVWSGFCQMADGKGYCNAGATYTTEPHPNVIPEPAASQSTNTTARIRQMPSNAGATDRLLQEARGLLERLAGGCCEFEYRKEQIQAFLDRCQKELACEEQLSIIAPVPAAASLRTYTAIIPQSTNSPTETAVITWKSRDCPSVSVLIGILQHVLAVCVGRCPKECQELDKAVKAMRAIKSNFLLGDLIRNADTLLTQPVRDLLAIHSIHDLTITRFMDCESHNYDYATMLMYTKG